MTRLLATLALLVSTLLAFPSPASATGVGPAAACSTEQRAPNRHVTTIEWLAGWSMRESGMRAGTRVFTGTREVVKPPKRRGNRVTRCRVKGDGTVVLRTDGGARIDIAQTIAPQTPHPDRVGRWAGPVTYHSTLSAEWQVAEAVAAWNAGLPADRHLAPQAEPCSVTTCISITSSPRLTQPHHTGEAHTISTDGQMTYCAIEVADYAAMEEWPTIVAHELGHCLGLPHWDYRGSIMYDGDGGWADLPSRYDLEWLAE